MVKRCLWRRWSYYYYRDACCPFWPPFLRFPTLPLSMLRSTRTQLGKLVYWGCKLAVSFLLVCLVLRLTPSPEASLIVSSLFQHPQLKHSGCRRDTITLVYIALGVLTLGMCIVQHRRMSLCASHCDESSAWITYDSRRCSF